MRVGISHKYRTKGKLKYTALTKSNRKPTTKIETELPIVRSTSGKDLMRRTKRVVVETDTIIIQRRTHKPIRLVLIRANPVVMSASNSGIL